MMAELVYLGGTRYEEAGGIRQAVYARRVHKPDCRHARARFGGMRITRDRAREILRDGLDTYLVNRGHRPTHSVWRTCKTCGTTIADIEEVSRG